MLAAILVFLVFAGSIVGGYYAVTLLPGYLAARRLDERLRDVSTDVDAADPKAAGDDTVLQHLAEGPLPGMDRLVSGTGVGKRMARLIEQSGVRTTPSAMALICLISEASVGLIVFMFV